VEEPQMGERWEVRWGVSSATWITINSGLCSTHQ